MSKFNSSADFNVSAQKPADSFLLEIARETQQKQEKRQQVREQQPQILQAFLRKLLGENTPR
jgi:hypothetical protein